MKSIIRSIFTLLYLAAIAVCLLMVIKPGTSLFFIKRVINNKALITDAGFAYRYRLEVNPHIFRTQGILVFEDGHALTRSEDNIVVEAGKSTYSISETSSGTGYLYLSSSDNSSPITNQRQYTLYIPMSFISRPLGGIYLIILLPGLVWFLVFAFADPAHRQVIFRSPRGTLTILDQFYGHISRLIGLDTEKTGALLRPRLSFWKQLFASTIAVTYFYILMEWVFIVTMPSFMSILSLMEKLEVFFLSSLVFAVLTMVVLVVFVLLDLLALAAHRSRLTSYLGLIIPDVILTALVLLLIDNFTYTLFKFGISTSTGIWRGVYGLLFISILIYFYTRLLTAFGLRGKEQKFVPRQWKRLFYLSLGVLVISTGIALTRLDITKLSSPDTAAEVQQAARRPNILLLGSDGISAEHLSVYGYERETTPWLQDLAQSSLLAENAFPNSGNSPGSVISIMTSKLPTTTRVGFAPDILTGVDAFEHLPGILKKQGYRNVEYGVPNYVDAYSFNMQNGFDLVNNRSIRSGKVGSFARKLGYDNTGYFLDKLAGRISERIQHIFYIGDMQNPYNIVTKPADGISDEEKINQTLELFDQSEQPLFVHIHLLGTHGPWFHPPVQVYSQGEEQDQVWMTDFYDDAILSFDQSVGKVVTHLKEIGQFDNTILIIYTDHNMAWHVSERIPLIIRFPGGDFSGRVTNNVQNLDIAPTILEYLGLSEPDWMSGESFLRGMPDNHRLIFGSGTIIATKVAETGWKMIDPELSKPPFYQFSYFSIINCQKWYAFSLIAYGWKSGDVPGHTNPCSADSLLSFDEINQAMKDRLSLDGFDVSSLP